MKANLMCFGEIEIEGQRYEHDVVIEAGRVSKRNKKPSKSLRDRYGHTRLSAQERIPWGGNRLIIGTGVYGNLPVTPEVNEEAEQRNIELTVLPTREACRLLEDLKSKDTYAVLHCTC
ncbi:MAG TPA: MTH938/NDUFAF3 family protein [Blastocatellia bacterium]|nr:MTH938/NDUFAF3 family protein [Blastocatellia bacterium]